MNPTLLSCIEIALRPIMRLCLRHGLAYKHITDIVKQALVHVAIEEINSSGEKINASRLCASTGVPRQEVQRIWRGETKEISAGYITRVIGQWERDPEFQTKSGKPRVLKYDGENADFQRLVGKVIKDIRPSAVLFALERIGAVETQDDGIRLVKKTFVTTGDPKRTFEFYASDSEDLLRTIQENAFEPKKIPHLHARTEYDNLSQKHLPAIRKWLFNEGSIFHKRCREYLSQFDHDLNPKLRGAAGGKAVLCSFSFCEKK